MKPCRRCVPRAALEIGRPSRGRQLPTRLPGNTSAAGGTSTRRPGTPVPAPLGKCPTCRILREDRVMRCQKASKSGKRGENWSAAPAGNRIRPSMASKSV